MKQHTKPTAWIVQHGWAFDRSCWNAWQAYLSSDSSLHMLDRGYFSNGSVDSDLKEEQLTGTHTIAVVHSLGLHLLPEFFFQFLDGLVIISGFISFNNPDTSDNSLVQAMLQKILQNTLEVLHRFYRRCGYVGELTANPSVMNRVRLIEDLMRLNSQSFDIKKINQIPKIILLHGSKDKIVPLEKSIELKRQLPQSKLFIQDDAGHALPFTHPEWCFQILKNELGNSVIGDVNVRT